jgi:hypothetical protein
MILSSAFLAIFGSYLFVLCRFSLAGFTVASLAAGALATCAYTFVSNTMDIAHTLTFILLPPDKAEIFVDKSRALLTPERLKALGEDLCKGGYVSRGMDFDSVSVSYGSVSNQLVMLNFSYSSYLCPSPTGTRSFVAAYARLVNAWVASGIIGNDPGLTKVAALEIYSEGSSLGRSVPLPSFYFRESANWDFLKTMHSSNSATTSALQNLRWLRDREPDPSFKTFLGLVSEELETIQRNPPPIQTGC